MQAHILLLLVLFQELISKGCDTRMSQATFVVCQLFLCHINVQASWDLLKWCTAVFCLMAAGEALPSDLATARLMSLAILLH